MRIHPKHTSEVLLQLQKETAYSNEWMLHTPGISVRPDNVDFFKTRKDAIFYNNGNRFGVLAPITSVITILQSIKELENLHSLEPVYVHIRAEYITPGLTKKQKEDLSKIHDNKDTAVDNQQKNSLLPKKITTGLLEKKRKSTNKGLGIR